MKITHEVCRIIKIISIALAELYALWQCPSKYAVQMNHNKGIELSRHYLGQVWVIRSLYELAELAGNYYLLRTTNGEQGKILALNRVIYYAWKF